MTAETKTEDIKNKVGNRRSQAGNKGGRRLETKETKSSAEITLRQNFKGHLKKKKFRQLPRPPLQVGFDSPKSIKTPTRMVMIFFLE